MDQPDSLVDVLGAYATTHTKDIPFTFLTDGEQETEDLSYEDFERQAKKIGASLQQMGLEGKCVLLLFPQSLEYLIALFGCFYAGVIAVPAYPPRNNRNLHRLQAIMENSGARHILTNSSGKTHMDNMKQEDFSSHHFLVYESMLETTQAWKQRVIGAQDVAYLQYTSGSTGNPKGVIITHENMVVNAKQCQSSYSDDMYCAFNWIPMYHDMGLMSMMSYFMRNARCYFMSPAHFVQKPFRWLDAISRYGVQFTLAPNFAFDLCCEKIKQEQLEGLDLSTLKDVITGSERVRVPTMLAFYERFKPCGFQLDAFIPSYGLAEATLIVTTTGPRQALKAVADEDLTEKKVLQAKRVGSGLSHHYHVSNGRPVAGASVTIVQPGTQQTLDEGQEGEIWVHFPGSVSKGYWNKEEASQAVFYNHLHDEGKRYLRTGDLGFLLEGELYVTGRIKDMIIVRGVNYYPEDIEFVANNAHDALAQNAAAAFSVEEDGQEKLMIVQEVRRAVWRSADQEEVIKAIRQAVAEAFEIMPHRIALISPMRLPKTSSGKIQRQKTRELLLKGKLRTLKEWVARDAREEKSAEAIQQAPVDLHNIGAWLRLKIAEKAKLKPTELSMEDAIQDYPLESIDAVYITNELSEWLGVDIKADVFWRFPSLQALADFVHDQYQEKQL
jgi:acyl-CoA synthetase (AMP-forming)/AMP-acid ligase II/acyl carrier protein